jgi:cytochrome c peroxidase
MSSKSEIHDKTQLRMAPTTDISNKFSRPSVFERTKFGIQFRVKLYYDKQISSQYGESCKSCDAKVDIAKKERKITGINPKVTHIFN